MEDRSKIVLRFVHRVLYTDLILAALIAILSYFLEIRTLEGYGTLLSWAGIAVMGFACLAAIGGFASRTTDIGAFSLSGAGNMSEQLKHVADARHSSLGCFTLLLSIGFGLIVIGNLFQFVGSFAF